jgi:hypothetical protein
VAVSGVVGFEGLTAVRGAIVLRQGRLKAGRKYIGVLAVVDVYIESRDS